MGKKGSEWMEKEGRGDTRKEKDEQQEVKKKKEKIKGRLLSRILKSSDNQINS